jgi:hypothetical protein
MTQSKRLYTKASERSCKYEPAKVGKSFVKPPGLEIK